MFPFMNTLVLRFSLLGTGLCNARSLWHLAGTDECIQRYAAIQERSCEASKREDSCGFQEGEESFAGVSVLATRRQRE